MAPAEDEAFILTDTARVIDAVHDLEPGAMVQFAVLPCSPFSVTEDLMRQAALARHRQVRLHTHLAEAVDEQVHTTEKRGVRPIEWMEQLDWAGADTPRLVTYPAFEP